MSVMCFAQGTSFYSRETDLGLDDSGIAKTGVVEAEACACLTRQHGTRLWCFQNLKVCGLDSIVSDWNFNAGIGSGIGDK
jgi:hypothetical protein